MELVPDDELEASSRGGSAPRSDPLPFFLFLREESILIDCYTVVFR